MSSNETDDDLEWEKKAFGILKSFYLSFRGSQFDQYLIGTEDERLLLAKICYALYGMPTIEGAEELWDGYPKVQTQKAGKILEIILKTHKEQNKTWQEKTFLLVGTIFIFCKQDKAEFTLPIFFVFTGKNPNDARESRVYIDSQGRTYANWDDWKSSNQLPKVKYAYPRRGFFTCVPYCSYEFDENKDPDIEFGTSPACSFLSQFFQTTDTVAGLTAFGCGLLGVASIFIPFGSAILLGAAYAGSGAATYGAGRAVSRLIDKGQHGESLSDLESFVLYFTIASTPLQFTTQLVNATLAKGAVENGRIFSEQMRMFATVLNFSVLGIDSVMIGFSFANLVEKYKQDQLTSLDVLQFSMSVFFFTNTLMKPKTASAIIKNAQDSHIQNYANSMKDADAKATFEKFVNQNKGSGGIKEQSKIIRTINKIEDGNSLFSGLKDSSNIQIGGRKGRTILVTDPTGQTTRTSTKNPGPNFAPKPSTSFNPNVPTKGSNDIVLNELPILREISSTFQKSVLALLIEKMNQKDLRKLLPLIQKVIKLVKQKFNVDLSDPQEIFSLIQSLISELKKYYPHYGMDPNNFEQFDEEKFATDIYADLIKANLIARENGFRFKNQFKVINYYRKYGEDFPNILREFKIEIYLTKIPSYLQFDGTLIMKEDIKKNNCSFSRKIYQDVTIKDPFAIVIENLNKKIQNYMFQLSKLYADDDDDNDNDNGDVDNAKLPIRIPYSFDPIDDIRNQITNLLGFIAYIPFYINLDTPDQRFKWTEEISSFFIKE